MKACQNPQDKLVWIWLKGNKCYEIKLRAQFSILVIKKGNAR